jgi:hypothetical protein
VALRAPLGRPRRRVHGVPLSRSPPGRRPAGRPTSRA